MAKRVVHLMAPSYVTRMLCGAVDRGRMQATVLDGHSRITCLKCRRALLLLVAVSLGATSRQIRNDKWLTISVPAKAA